MNFLVFTIVQVLFYFIHCHSITTTTTASSSSSIENNSKEELFTKWFIKNGGFIHSSVQLYNFNEMGRGFSTNKKINENDRILYIPSNLIFSNKNIHHYLHKDILKLLKTIITSPDSILVAWLLLEKINSNSFFKPYIDILPEHVSTPIQFNDMELFELQNYRLVDEIHEMIHHAKEEYQKFLQFYDKLKTLKSSIIKSYITTTTTTSNVVINITYHDYIWALSMFNSRGLRFKGNVFLSPMADIFNYAPHPTPRPAQAGDFFLQHHQLIDNKDTMQSSSGSGSSNGQAGSIIPDQTHTHSGGKKNPISYGGIQILSDRIHDPNIMIIQNNNLNNSNIDTSTITSTSTSSSTIAKAKIPLQVFEDYGDNSDEIYLKYHGFVPDMNPFRCINLEMNMTLKDITPFQKALLDGLEFKRPPTRCIDAISISHSSLNTKKTSSSSSITSDIDTKKSIDDNVIINHGYFGKGLEIYVMVLSMNTEEVLNCLNIIGSNSKENNKNWKNIFRDCDFSNMEVLLNNIRSDYMSTNTEYIRSVRDKSDIKNILKLKVTNDMSFIDRILLIIHKLIIETLNVDGIRTTITEDLYLLSETHLSSSTSSKVIITKDNDYHTAIHKLLAIKYRMHRKILLVSLAKHYKLDLSTLLIGEINNIIEKPIKPKKILSLSTKIQRFNDWFIALQPFPCSIIAKEISGFRIGTIATMNIKNDDIYLGINVNYYIYCSMYYTYYVFMMFYYIIINI